MEKPPSDFNKLQIKAYASISLLQSFFSSRVSYRCHYFGAWYNSIIITTEISAAEGKNGRTLSCSIGTEKGKTIQPDSL